MSNTRLTKSKSEEAKTIQENKINYAGQEGSETIYLTNFDMYTLSNSTDDEPMYKSLIKIGGKEFDIYIKYNQGRKLSSPIHLIISSEGSRHSLGFYNDIHTALHRIKMFVYMSVTGLNPPATLK